MMRLVNPQRAKDERAIKAMKRAVFPLAVFTITWITVWLLVGCSSTKIEYRPVPAYLVPLAPELPKILAVDLLCLSDETYTKLAMRDRLLRQYGDELRALLGVSK